MHNRLPVSGRKGKIPYVYWNNPPNAKLNYSHLRIFGCAAYVTLPPTLREDKLLPTSICGVIVGYETNRKSHRIYLLQLKKVITTKDVVFDENVFPLANSKESHEAYDFAIGTLQGVSRCPTTDYNTFSNTTIIPENQNLNQSCIPIPSESFTYSGFVPMLSSNLSSVSPQTAVSSVMPSESTETNSEPSLPSISIDNDDPADPTYIPSQTAPSPTADVKIPDYVPDQSDNIENNTNSLLHLIKRCMKVNRQSLEP